jgi:hypothetical protein
MEGIIKKIKIMNEQKLIQLIDDVEFTEDFIKISAVDKKIDTQTANEILRLIREMKERALK